MILTNGLVLLAGAALAYALKPSLQRTGNALIWLSAAPVIMINLDFTWTKLLATAFFMLSATAVIKRHLIWAGVWAGMAYLSHPVGALLTPMLVIFAVHLKSGETQFQYSRFRCALGTIFEFISGWLLCTLPWLIYKIYLSFYGIHDAFFQYMLGDGRGPIPASSWGTWLACRWHNTWYSFIPFTFFKSEYMKVWIEGPVSEPMRWGIAYAKNLPAGLGHGVFLAAIWFTLKPSIVLPVGFRRWMIAGTSVVMLAYGGFASDGLGRNCLEPLIVLWVVYTAVANNLPRWLIYFIAILSLCEAFSVRWIGLSEGKELLPLDLECTGLGVISVIAGISALCIGIIEYRKKAIIYK